MVSRKMWIVVLVALALVGCSGPATAPTTAPVVTDAEGGSGSAAGAGAILASGKVVPQEEAVLGVTVPGRVEWLAAEGEWVEEGAVVLRLDPTLLEADVLQSEALLEAAQAQLALLLAGSRPEQLAAVEADLAAAQAGVALAEAQRSQLTSAGLQEAVGAVRVEIAAAEAQVVTARQAYSEIESRKDAEDWELETARLELIAAEQRREAAEAQVALVQRSAASDAALAEAAVAQAAAGQQSAEAQLALVAAGPTAAAVAGAEAAVAQAEAGVEAALAALAEAELTAPFAGQVVRAAVDVGETVLPGQAALTMAKLDLLQVETTDLGELDVVRVAPGQAVAVHVEALDAQVEGRVARIAERGAPGGSNVVYTVLIDLLRQPAGLRWGMTAELEIDVAGD